MTETNPRRRSPAPEMVPSSTSLDYSRQRSIYAEPHSHAAISTSSLFSRRSFVRSTIPLAYILVLALSSFIPLTSAAAAPPHIYQPQYGLNNDRLYSSTITAPPNPAVTGHGIYKRAATKTAPDDCPFGSCGNACLAEGDFCCNPGGRLAQEPQWVCGNGACVTSVSGSVGMVDCADPTLAPSATKSCVDYAATTSCAPDQPCITCGSDLPFCNWETYIHNVPSPTLFPAPTLRWYQCGASPDPSNSTGSTFLASNVLANTLLEPEVPEMLSTGNTTSLSSGAIIGLSAGGAAAVILLVCGVVWCVMRRRKRSRREQTRRLAAAKWTTEEDDRRRSMRSSAAAGSKAHTRGPSDATTLQDDTLGRPVDGEELNVWKQRHGSASPQAQGAGSSGGSVGALSTQNAGERGVRGQSFIPHDRERMVGA